MELDDMIIVSVDDHIIEPPTMFDAHVSGELRDKVPQFLTDDDGNNFWVYEDRKVVNVGLNAVVGRPREEFGVEPTSLSQMRKGCYDVHARIGDMNANGLLASLNFGTFVRFDGAFFIGSKDKVLTNRVIQAYNDWHIDEWCGAYPGRFIPMAILPLWDVDLVVEEIKRVLKKGCHAITFCDNPAGRGLPSIHNEYWEPLWCICNDNNVIINCHIGTGHPPPHPSMDSPIDAWITSMPIAIANSAADWLHLKALQKYPNLTISLSEGGIGWIPYFLERADFTFEHHHQWTNADFGGRKPSDIFREHFITCFVDDQFGVKSRHDIGIDTICIECDYPHSDAVWPEMPEYIYRSVKDIPEEEANKITHLNAMRVFDFDPFSILGRENCTVGALREQAKHVDTRVVSFCGNDPRKGNDNRPVTSGDVLRLFDEQSGAAA